MRILLCFLLLAVPVFSQVAARDDSPNSTAKTPVIAGRANAAAPTWTEGHQVPLSVDLTGAMRVNVVAGGAGGGLAQLQVRSNTNVWTDVGFFAGNLALPAEQSGSWVVGQSGLWNMGLLAGTNLVGKFTLSQGGNDAIVSAAGNLRVDCQVGCSASSFSDNSAFTAGTTNISNSGGVFNDGLAAVTSGNAATPRITASRAFHINLRNNTGTEIGTAGAPLRTDPTGSTTQPVSGTVTANAGTGTFTIGGTVTANAGTNLNTSALALESGGNLAKIPLAQSSTTAGQSGPLVQGAVTTSAPSYTNAQTNPLSLNTSGGLRVDGSGVTQPVSGTVTANAGTGTFTVGQSTATNLNAAVVGTGTAGSPAGNILTVQGVASMTKLLVTPDSVALPANQSVNVSQIGGTNTVTAGVSGLLAVGGNVANGATATSNPVPVGGVFTTTPATLTTGQTATAQFTAAQNLKTDLSTIAGTAPTTAGKVDVKGADGDVFVRQTTASNLNAAVVGTGTAGSPAGNILTVQGVASMTKLLVTPDSVALPANQSVNVAQVGGTNTVTGGVAGIIAVGGNVANAVAATANPVPVGGIFTTTPTTLTTGQTATLQFTAAQNVKTDMTTVANTATVTAAAGVQRVGIAGNGNATLDSPPDATAPTNVVNVAGRFVTTPATLTTGQAGSLQLTAAQNLKTDYTTVAGTAALTGNGATGAGSARVTVSNDNTAIANWGQGATGSAPPTGAVFQAGIASGATGGLLQGITVCDQWVDINTTANAQLIAGVSGRKVYFCSGNIQMNGGANTVAFVSGTGTVCATNTATIPGFQGSTTAANGYSFAANSGMNFGGSLTPFARSTNNADNICILVGSATRVVGGLNYAIY